MLSCSYRLTHCTCFNMTAKQLFFLIPKSFSLLVSYYISCKSMYQCEVQYKGFHRYHSTTLKSHPTQSSSQSDDALK